MGIPEVGDFPTDTVLAAFSESTDDVFPDCLVWGCMAIDNLKVEVCKPKPPATN